MAFTDEHITKMRQGNLAVIEEIHCDMYYSLCLYGQKIVTEIDVVEDVVQEAFIALWNKKEEFTNIYRVKAYLYTVVRNKLLTHIRLKKTVPFDTEKFDIEDNELEIQILREELYKDLRKAIADLPTRTQKVINYKISGYTNIEIAKLLGISVNTVKTLQKSGYSKLRKTLKGNVFLIYLVLEILQ